MTGAGAAQRAGLAALALGLGLAAGLGGCGVPDDDQPRALAPRDVPYGSVPSSPVAEPEGDVRLTLGFVRDGQVEPVPRSVERAPSTTELVELLFGGPAPDESETGLISVIPPTVRVEDVDTSGGTAVITLSGPESEVLRIPPLAFAQIVVTLVPDRADGVRFRASGRDLPVPLADSSLTAAPLTRDDYAELLSSGAAGPGRPSSAAGAPTQPVEPPSA